MIKVLILCGIMALTTFVGFETSKTYSKKVDLYSDLLDFCRSVKNEITFLKTDIMTIYGKNTYKSELNDIIKKITNLINNNKLVEANDIKGLLNQYSDLSDKDKELISGLFYNLGRLNYDQQIESLEYYIECFDDLVKKQIEKSNKMTPFCKKIGILIGLTICIMLI